MRKAVVIAGAVAVLVGLAGVAYAATTTATLTANITGTTAGTAAHPRNVSFRAPTATIRNSDNSQPPQALTISVLLDRKLRVNGAAFSDAADPPARRCTVSALNAAHNAAPTSTNNVGRRCLDVKIGTARATAQAGSLNLNFQTYLYGLSSSSIIVSVKQTPSGTDLAFPAFIRSGPAPFGKRIDITVPLRLRQIQPGNLWPSVKGLTSVVIGAVTGRFIQSIGCTGGHYTLGVKFTFTSIPPGAGNAPNGIPSIPPITKTTTSTCH